MTFHQQKSPPLATILWELERACFDKPWTLEQLDQETRKTGFLAFCSSASGTLHSSATTVTGKDSITPGCDMDWQCYSIWNYQGADQLLELYRIGVVPAARNQGQGALHLHACLRFLKDTTPFKRVLLEVHSANTAARRLYSRTGFQELYTRKNYYGKESACVMEWSH